MDPARIPSRTSGETSTNPADAPPDLLRSQISEIVQQALRDWAAGQKVSIAGLVGANPGLQPDLERELRKVQLIAAAADKTTDDTADGWTGDVADDTTADSGDTNDPANMPKRLGQFQMEQPLGQGAFGQVWQAWDTELRRAVAIKLPHPALMTQQTLEQFQREARIAAQLSHPNIVRLYEVGQQDGWIYFVTELIDGCPLQQWRLESAPSATQAARLVAAIADAADYAHQQGVIHRDLKPANILMAADDQPQLLDFGLAKQTAAAHAIAEQTLAADGPILGTPAYMSPEQAAGQANTVDGRTDVYSIGVILFELLTDELPFRGSVQMLIQHVLHQPPPQLRQLASGVPIDLETICLKCLRKQPAERYATAADLAADLRRFLDGRPIVARPLNAAQKFQIWARREPWKASLLAVLAALAIGGPLVGWHQYWQRVRIGKLYQAELRLTDRLQAQQTQQSTLWQSSVGLQSDADGNSTWLQAAAALALRQLDQLPPLDSSAEDFEVERLMLVRARALLQQVLGRSELALQGFEACLSHLERLSQSGGLPAQHADAIRMDCWLRVATLQQQLGNHDAAREAAERLSGLAGVGIGASVSAGADWNARAWLVQSRIARAEGRTEQALRYSQLAAEALASERVPAKSLLQLYRDACRWTQAP